MIGQFTLKEAKWGYQKGKNTQFRRRKIPDRIKMLTYSINTKVPGVEISQIWTRITGKIGFGKLENYSFE